MLQKFALRQLQNLVGMNGGEQSGGCKECGIESLTLFLVLMVFLLVRAYILQITFNYIVPRLMRRYGNYNTNQPMRELTYTEAVVLLIMTNTLVGR